jgi:sterol 3beta-glucosyltransferase
MPHTHVDHRMASSIHAIHRPVARSQRRERASKGKGKMAQEIFMSDTEEEERHYPTILSEEEDDFDPPTIPADSPTPLNPTPSTPASRRLLQRFSTTGSIATIRVKRRSQLADKLRDIFDLNGIQQVVAGQHRPLSFIPALCSLCSIQKFRAGCCDQCVGSFACASKHD